MPPIDRTRRDLSIGGVRVVWEVREHTPPDGSCLEGVRSARDPCCEVQNFMFASNPALFDKPSPIHAPSLVELTEIYRLRP